MENIQELIEQEIEQQKAELQQYNDSLVEINNNLHGKISDLKNQLQELQKGDLFSKYAKNITKENIEEFCKFIFPTVYNDENTGSTTTAPMPFYLTIKYWNERELLWSIFDLAGIQYNQWIKTIEIPYEWGKEQCQLFLDTMGNHYVCNGCIYSGNMGFWNQAYSNKTTEKLMRTQYSEIPWQFVLKNPIWLEEDMFDKVVNCINTSHGVYFSLLCHYQTLSTPQAEKMIRVLVNNKWINEYNSESRKGFAYLWQMLPENSPVFDEFNSKGIIPKFIGNNLPKRLKKAHIESRLSEGKSSSLIKEAIDSKLFTKKELTKFL